MTQGVPRGSQPPYEHRLGFAIDNRSSSKFEVKLMVEVLDKSGLVIKAGDRSPSVGAHSAEEARVSTRIRTIEAADAPKVRLRAAIIPK